MNIQPKAALVIIACAVCLLYFGCIAPGLQIREQERQERQAQPTPTVPRVADAPAPSQKTISRASMGKDWPFTVESGVLACHAHAVTFTTGGTTYTLNGTALDRAKSEGWKDIGESSIWAIAPPRELGLKKSIGPLIREGLALCH